jgi:methionine-rich copper-binding protein CopC
MAIIDDISALYVAYFNRAPDVAGLQFWIGRAGGIGGPAMSLVDIANSFAVQPEATGQYGFLTAPGVADAGTFLASVYLNLFGRVVAPTATELDYWKAQLANPAIPVGRVLLDIRSGALGPDLAVITNKTAVAKAFAQADANVPGLTSLAQQQGALADVTADPATVAAIIAENTASLTDTTAPTVTALQTFSNAENKAADALLGTVLATDNTGGSGVGSFAITTGNTDGFFAIAADGKITLTAAGAAATSAANDFEKSPNTFVLGVTATDKAGNVGAATNVTLNVTDVDDTAPKFVAANAAGTTITLSFDEALKAATLPASAFTVVDSVTNASITLNSVAVSGTKVTLVTAVAPANPVKVSYTPPATGDVLQDAALNKVLAVPATTAGSDSVAPTLVSSAPTDNATNFAAADNIVLTFSEDVLLGSGNITITNAADATDTRTIAVNDAAQISLSGKAVTINPTLDLKVGANYNVTVAATAVLDKAGNAYVGISDATTLNFAVVALATPGSTFTLSNSTITGLFDNIAGTAGDDTIIGGPGATQTGDVLNGGAGIDRLNTQQGGGAAVTISPTLALVERVFLNEATFGAIGANTTFSLINATGVTEVWADRVTDADGGKNDGVVFTNFSKAVQLGVLSGDTGLLGANRADVTFTLSDLAGTADAVSLVLEAASVNDITINAVGGVGGAETVTVTGRTASSRADGTLLINAATKVVFSGDQGIRIDGLLDVDATKDYVVDASTLTGALRITLEDQVAGKTTNVKGGSGNDIFFLTTGLDTADALDGGAGTNAIGFTTAADLTAATGANLKNFQVFEASGATAGTYDMDLITGGGLASTITSVSLRGALTGNTVINNLVDTGGVTLGASTGAFSLTINQKGAADAGSNADTLTFNIAGVLGNATINSLIAANIETVTIASNETPGFSTGHTVTATTFANATTVKFTGNEQLTVTALGATLASSIDASAMTDSFILTAADAATVLLLKGGSANDTLTLSDTVQLAGTTVQGNGGSDAINLDTDNTTTTVSFNVKLAAQADSTAAAFDKVTNFVNFAAEGVNGDNVDVSAFAFAVAAQDVTTATAKVTISGAAAAASFSITDANATGFFATAAVNKGVAFAVSATDTFVFVDVNKDGNWSAAADSVLELIGTTTALVAGDFVFV